MGFLDRGIFGKGLTSEEAKKKAVKTYEEATGRKAGSGTKKEKIGAYLFFGSIIFLVLIYLLKLFLL